MFFLKKEKDGAKRVITILGLFKFSYIKTRQYERERERANAIALSGIHSQVGQDKFIAQLFNHKKDGFFIEIGANDGLSLSNTRYFDDIGWKGICIEPLPETFKKLCKNRPDCHKYNVAISDKNGFAEFTMVTGPEMLSGLTEHYDQRHIDRIDKEVAASHGKQEIIKVETCTFDKIMSDFPDVKTIDYISIDTEGNEFMILQNIDFEKYDIRALTVENNYNDIEPIEFMKSKGYKHIKVCHDDFYIKEEL